MDGTALRVAIVDDDEEQLEMYARWLRHADIEVLPIKSEIGSVTNKVAAFKPHVVLVDLNMPHLPGRDLIKLMRSKVPNACYVVFSAENPEQIRRVQLETGANGALSKSTPLRMFVAAIKTYEDA